MQSYSQKEAIDKHDEVFDKAAIEPVLLTRASQPTHVLMSADKYQQLVNRIEELEDVILGQAAQKARKESNMVGVEITSTLQGIANCET